MDLTTSMDSFIPATDFFNDSSGATAIILLFAILFLMSGTILQIVASGPSLRRLMIPVGPPSCRFMATIFFITSPGTTAGGF